MNFLDKWKKWGLFGAVVFLAISIILVPLLNSYTPTPTPSHTSGEVEAPSSASDTPSESASASATPGTPNNTMAADAAYDVAMNLIQTLTATTYQTNIEQIVARIRPRVSDMALEQAIEYLQGVDWSTIRAKKQFIVSEAVKLDRGREESGTGNKVPGSVVVTVERKLMGSTGKLVSKLDTQTWLVTIGQGNGGWQASSIKRLS